MDSKQKWIASLGFSVSRKDTYTTLIKYICYRLTRLLSFVTGIIAMTFTHQVQARYHVFLPLHMQSVKFILTISKGDSGQEKRQELFLVCGLTTPFELIFMATLSHQLAYI